MIYLKTSYKRAAGILLAALFPILAFSQEAENIYHKEYSKLSIVFQPSILKKSDASNKDGASYPSMKFTNDMSYQFGVYYNFAQSGAFNFKTGVIAKEFIPKFDLIVSENDIGYGEEYLLSAYDPYNQFIISIPLKSEYYLNIGKNLNVVVGAGINLNIITGASEQLVSSIGVGNSDGSQSKDIFYLSSEPQSNINISSEFSAGLNYKASFALIDLSIYMNNSMGKEYVSGKYQFVNLNQTPDKSGNFSIKSNFYGLTLTVSPKKGWLRGG